ncbi:alkaline phosphatase family protein [Aurantimonas aggregata]|uniref:alkaline phosphatase family protein n=1 Tax=Aurantimonas aggregata TaxID=2047720 RepID=UPI001FE8D7CF|nr:alkaline phosphatase family protein [Aurantimonas aggregata]
MIIDRPAAATTAAAVGPILYARGGDDEQHSLAALLVLPEGALPPELLPEDGAAAVPIVLASCFGRTVWRYDFALPADRTATYRLGDQQFTVASPAASDRRIVYVSCNGQETGDLDREDGERDAMWTRLAAEHRRTPFALMLQGGDQLYADDVLHAHPSVERWATAPRDARGDIAFEPAADDAVRRFYFERYIGNFGRAAMRTVAAEIPSVMMWDDHDIIDGWGSHPATLLDSPIGRGLFAAARDMFLLFQVAATDAALPSTVMDQSGETLGLVLRYPDLALLAPDLRSERRPDRVMGPAGWAHFEAALAATPPWDRVLLMSSVPALGPRLSWLEALADMLPVRNKYEDDMRDQWQSRVHRDEWVRFLSSWPSDRKTPTSRSPSSPARSIWRHGARCSSPTSRCCTSWSPPASPIRRRRGPIRQCSASWRSGASRRCRAIRSSCGRCRDSAGLTRRSEITSCCRSTRKPWRPSGNSSAAAGRHRWRSDPACRRG